MKYKQYIREHPDKNRCDLTQLFLQPEILVSLGQDLSRPFQSKNITKVVAIDALGFVLGGLCAVELGCGLVLVRKNQKTAWVSKSAEFKDYSEQTKRLEIAIDALSSGDRVLIVDDWSETGTQLRVAIQLVEESGAEVVGAAMIHIGQRILNESKLSKYHLHSLESYE